MTATVPTTTADISLVQKARVISSTKDSVKIGWIIHDQYQSQINGVKISYQAEGSTIVTHTPLLESDVKYYDIQNLHENTYYKMCIITYGDINGTAPDPCVRATTSVDSLHVALGSTFGAFLALGIIVMFVFIAKWQNSRKLKKQLRNMTPVNDKYDSMPPNDGDIEMSDVSLNVHDTQSSKAHDANSYSSQVSGYHSYTNQSRKSIPNSDTGNPDGTGATEQQSNNRPRRKSSHSHHSSRSASPNPPAISPPPEPSDRSKIRKQKSTDSHHSYHSGGAERSPPPNATAPPPPVAVKDVLTGDPPSADTQQNAKRDYGGARPKEFSPNDPRNLYANSAYVELPTDENTGLRPNLSCKW